MARAGWLVLQVKAERGAGEYPTALRTTPRRAYCLVQLYLLCRPARAHESLDQAIAPAWGTKAEVARMLLTLAPQAGMLPLSFVSLFAELS